MFFGRVTYRRSLSLTSEELEKPVFLEIGAASLSCVLFVNQKEVSHSECGFAMLRYEITSYLHLGKNEIVIEVSNEANPKIYPAMADFSFYGGLYRYVHLVLDEGSHFAELDGSRDGIVLIPTVLKGKGVLDVRANAVAEEAVAMEVRVGKAVQRTAFSQAEERELSLTIDEVHLWDGIEDPYLYEVEVKLISASGEVLDSRSLKTGFKEFSFDPKVGSLLNHKPYPLKGAARHQDFGGVRNAITLLEMKKDIALLQEMGANSVRLSHYQHSDDFYSLCDEAGLLVYAEIPVISAVNASPEADQNALK